MLETVSYFATRQNVDDSIPSKYKQIKNNNNNNSNNKMYYQQYSFDVSTAVNGVGVGGVDCDVNEKIYNFMNPSELMARLVVSKEDAKILEQSPSLQNLIRKSHSYCGQSQILPKSSQSAQTVIRQDSLNGRIIATTHSSLTTKTTTTNDNVLLSASTKAKNFVDTVGTSLHGGDSSQESSSVVFVHDSASPTGGTTGISGNDMDMDQEDALLLPDSSSTTATSPAHRNNNNSSRRSYDKSSSSKSSSRTSMCLRLHAYITRNWYLNYLVPTSILIALIIVAYLTRDYAKRLLFWIEVQNPWLTFAIFTLLFIIVSFPVAVGYFVLMITSGYLFGFFKGLMTVILGANIGTALAHITIRALRHRIPLHRFVKNETGRAIMRVITGPRAFRVVLFTRLTPLPFGLQNAMFGVSSINPRTYYTASFIGLLPAQIINVYLGSTLRSMHEVLNSHGTAVTGYISFGIEVICGLALMLWVVQKARKELSETLLSCGTEKKIIDIEV